jgi:hypothetical protein
LLAVTEIGLEGAVGVVPALVVELVEVASPVVDLSADEAIFRDTGCGLAVASTRRESMSKGTRREVKVPMQLDMMAMGTR